jgi:NADH dehydrogenase (ubiquinone) flavoprotein 2
MKQIQQLTRFYPFRRYFSTVQVNHTPDPHNTTSHVFNFTPENEQKIEVLLRKYPSNYKRSAVIPMLFVAQEQNGNFLSLSAMNKVAEILEMPPIDVYEVASFYTMFNRTKVGRFHLQVCGTTPCMVRGSEKVIKALEDHLHIKLGETTPDMMFTISEVECLGACANAPMMQVNNQWVYEDLDEQNVIDLIEKFRSGQEVKVGPQNNRRNSEGPIGRTSLKDSDWLSQEHRFKRDFGQAKTEWEKAKEEAAKVAQAQAQAKTATPPPPPAQPTPTPTQTPKPAEPSPNSKVADTKSPVQSGTESKSAKEQEKTATTDAKDPQKQSLKNQESQPETKISQMDKKTSENPKKDANVSESKTDKTPAPKSVPPKAQAKTEPSKTGGQKDKQKK